MSTAPHGAGDAGLPPPSREARAHGDQVFAHVAASIGNAGGWISFAGYMAAVMYAPGLGYYSAGARKFGSAGDFVTAPELTPLFGAAVAATAADVIDRLPDADLLELRCRLLERLLLEAARDRNIRRLLQDRTPVVRNHEKGEAN